MSKKYKIGLGVIIAVVLVVMGYRYFHKVSLGSTTLDCASNTTCLPSMKLTGNPDGAALATVGTSDLNGAVTVTGNVTATSITAGSGNTVFTGLVAGTCNLSGMDASQTASTSKAYSCTGITGLTSSYKVIAQLASSSPMTPFLGWVVMSAKASTTAGAVDVVVANMTGAAVAPSIAGVGSSTVIWGFK